MTSINPHRMKLVPNIITTVGTPDHWYPAVGDLLDRAERQCRSACPQRRAPHLTLRGTSAWLRPLGARFDPEHPQVSGPAVSAVWRRPATTLPMSPHLEATGRMRSAQWWDGVNRVGHARSSTAATRWPTPSRDHGHRPLSAATLDRIRKGPRRFQEALAVPAAPHAAVPRFGMPGDGDTRFRMLQHQPNHLGAPRSPDLLAMLADALERYED